MAEAGLIALSAGGVGLVLDASGPSLPSILHWGVDLGPLDGAGSGSGAGAGAWARFVGALPEPGRALIPSQGAGWFGRPALSGHRDGKSRPVRFLLTEPVAVRWGAEAAGGGRRSAGVRGSAGVGGSADVSGTADVSGSAGVSGGGSAGSGGGWGTVVVRAADVGAGLALESELELTAQGVLRVRHTITNTAADEPAYTVERLAALMPVPAQAVEVLDFAGRWARERSPQRAPIRQGAWVRENRRGRTGFDAGLLVAGTDGFGFRAGRVWAVHSAWSGNHVQYVERLADGGAVVGGGELLEPGEIRLSAGESYQSPWVYFGTSDAGLDGLSAGFHRMLRARAGHPVSARPVTLNIWEAVYFDQSADRLLELADKAAAIGVERFVVDDGWFRHRRTDNAGLGDWYVDEGVWPQGLHPLVERVRKHGMQFGLWFEPEMVNPDSDLARAHPDWFLADPERLPAESRNQQVLDVARPEAYAYLLERISALVSEYRIDYIKWDHNRDLAEPLHDGVAGAHAQTAAVYRLLDELRSRHPALEIESCSSGGARVDLGVLERTDRVWGSDDIDPVERQSIQRWTSLLIPYELIGSHVGSSPAHVTGRATDLSFRAATALFGHAGIEADITGWGEDELGRLAGWIEAYKRLRPLLHSGEIVRVDHPDPAAWVHGVVAADGTHALFAYVQLATSTYETAAALRFPGLNPEADYEVSVLPEVSDGVETWPRWAKGGDVDVDERERGQGRLVVPGWVLGEVGVAAPHLVNRPGRAFVVELRRV